MWAEIVLPADLDYYAIKRHALWDQDRDAVVLRFDNHCGLVMVVTPTSCRHVSVSPAVAPGYRFPMPPAAAAHGRLWTFGTAAWPQGLQTITLTGHAYEADADATALPAVTVCTPVQIVRVLARGKWIVGVCTNGRHMWYLRCDIAARTQGFVMGPVGSAVGDLCLWSDGSVEDVEDWEPVEEFPSFAKVLGVSPAGDARAVLGTIIFAASTWSKLRRAWVQLSVLNQPPTAWGRAPTT